MPDVVERLGLGVERERVRRLGHVLVVVPARVHPEVADWDLVATGAVEVPGFADRHGGQPRETLGIEADLGAAQDGPGGGAGVGGGLVVRLGVLAQCGERVEQVGGGASAVNVPESVRQGPGSASRLGAAAVATCHSTQSAADTHRPCGGCFVADVFIRSSDPITWRS